MIDDEKIIEMFFKRSEQGIWNSIPPVHSNLLLSYIQFVDLTEKNISMWLPRIREKMKQYLIEREVFV